MPALVRSESSATTSALGLVVTALIALLHSATWSTPGYAAEGGRNMPVSGGAKEGFNASSSEGHRNGHASAQLNSSYAHAAQSVMNWNEALKAATINPLDDWRRRDLEKSYKEMTSAVKGLESGFHNGTFSSGLTLVQTDLSSVVDPKAADHPTDSASGKASAKGEDSSSTRGVAPSDPTSSFDGGHYGLNAGLLSSSRPELANLSVDERRLPAPLKNEGSDKSATLTGSSKDTGTEGFPLRETGKLAELQSALALPAEKAKSGLLSEAEGSDENRSGKAVRSDGTESISTEAEALASAEDDGLVNEEDILQSKSKDSWLARWLGDSDNGHSVLAGSLSRVFGKDWAGVYGKPAHRVKRRHLLAMEDETDWSLLLLKWLILPSFLALLVWATLNFRSLSSPSRIALATGGHIPPVYLRLDPQSMRQDSHSNIFASPDDEEISTAVDIKAASEQYFVWFDAEAGKWVLAKADSEGNIIQSLGNLSAGSVVRATLLTGKQAFQRFKLNPKGRWIPTAEREQYLFSRKVA